MTITISAPTNGNRTVTWTKTAASQKVLDTAEHAAHYYFDLGFGDHGTESAPRTWLDQTNNEKLILYDSFLVYATKKAARDYFVSDAVEDARIAADANNNFDLNI